MDSAAVADVVQDRRRDRLQNGEDELRDTAIPERNICGGVELAMPDRAWVRGSVVVMTTAVLS